MNVGGRKIWEEKKKKSKVRRKELRKKQMNEWIKKRRKGKRRRQSWKERKEWRLFSWILWQVSNIAINTNSSIHTQLNGSEYCYVQSFVIRQLNGFKYKLWLISSIWPIDGTLTGTISSCQSELGSNRTAEELHIFPNSKIWTLPPDIVQSQTEGTCYVKDLNNSKRCSQFILQIYPTGREKNVGKV